jgi:hypothetical protein
MPNNPEPTSPIKKLLRLPFQLRTDTDLGVGRRTKTRVSLILRSVANSLNAAQAFQPAYALFAFEPV